MGKYGVVVGIEESSTVGSSIILREGGEGNKVSKIIN